MTTTNEIMDALNAQFPQLFSIRDGATVLDLEKVRLTAGEGNYKDKYGLRWETKPEHFDDVSLGRVPVLTAVPGKSLTADDKKPAHVLIQGDNYHALQVLQYTHAGAVDVIYIDPPYNTGNKDFKYNDKFVDKDDGYRHSKWLSFMAKRLKLARVLLKESGAIFISIDENEQAPLRLLCDEIFGENNFVNALAVKRRPKNLNAQFSKISSLNVSFEYVLVYRKTDKFAYYNPRKAKESSLRDGYWSAFYSSADRPTMRYEISGVSLSKGQWKWSKDRGLRAHENYLKLETGSKDNLKDYWDKNNKSYLGETGFPLEFVRQVGRTAQYWVSPSDVTLMDTNLLDYYVNDDSAKREFGFATAKNPTLIGKLIDMAGGPTAVVLDFFAGSGTTAHAVMQLNAKVGTRQCILVTNDEGEFKDDSGALLLGGICTNVTHPRVIKVIQGYTTLKGKVVPGLGGNLAFFETAFHDEPRTRGQMAEFFKVATDVLCLKSGCFEPVSESPDWRVFKSAAKSLLVFFDDIPTEALEAQVEALTGPIDLYTFAYDDGDDMAEHFAHLPNVTVHEIPRPLLDLYKRTK